MANLYDNWREMEKWNLKDAYENALQVYDNRRDEINNELDRISKEVIDPLIKERGEIFDKRNELCKEMKNLGFDYNFKDGVWFKKGSEIWVKRKS